MPLTQITFQSNDPVYTPFAQELAKRINQFTEKTAVFQKEEFHNDGTYSLVRYVYDDYSITFKEVGVGTFEIILHGMNSVDKTVEEARATHDELFDFCEGYLKKLNLDLFLTVSFYKFRKSREGDDECIGGTLFSDFTQRKTAVPLNEELRKLQEVAKMMSEYFPITYEGRAILSGQGKVRKEHTLDLVDEGGAVKIGVFQKGLIITIQTEKDVQDLVIEKEKKMKELKLLKQDAINELKTLDPKFQYDGKNGLVFFGTKATFTVEYDVFTKEYLATFLKSKLKTSTLPELEQRINGVVLKNKR